MIGSEATLLKLNSYTSSLSSIENIDEDELEQSRSLGRKIARMLSYPSPTPTDQSSVSSSTDIASRLRDNPLINTEWLSPDKRVAFLECIDGAHSSQKEYDESKAEGEPFVPLTPPRFIEWESSKVDCCMWRIPNINNLAPLSIEMWKSWASLSAADVTQCRTNALRDFSWIETSPPFVTSWPMTVFGAPKYKCPIAAGAKIRGNFVTSSSRSS